MINEIDSKLLEKIADLIGKPVGAFNIRKDSGCEAQQSTEHIEITSTQCPVLFILTSQRSMKRLYSFLTEDPSQS